jgi:hypothetical protein
MKHERRFETPPGSPADGTSAAADVEMMHLFMHGSHGHVSRARRSRSREERVVRRTAVAARVIK